jgi:3D (Asp-Asp-Asp) domain-containing protein
MYVPGYGCGTVQDRGGAIQGSHIDAWFSSTHQAMQWGVPQIDVEVCDDAH